MSEDVFRWVILAAVLVACLSFVVQAVVMFAIYGRVRKMQQRTTSLADRAEPILATTEKMLAEVRPHLSEISAETVQIVKNARVHSEKLGDLLQEATETIRVRLGQIDSTVEGAMAQVDIASGAVRSAVLRPVKEVNGLMAGFKAALSSYTDSTRRAAIENATQDEEMFI